ncbi:hypothetical protein D3C87_1857740 [compost metagenome]
MRQASREVAAQRVGAEGKLPVFARRQQRLRHHVERIAGVQLARGQRHEHDQQQDRQAGHGARRTQQRASHWPAAAMVKLFRRDILGEHRRAWHQPPQQ